MSRNASLTLNELAYRVWGAEPPGSAASILYGHVSRLRSLLRGCPAKVSLERSRDGGYQLQINGDDVDLFHVRSLVERAKAQEEAHDLAAAAALWRQACEIWDGSIMLGIGGSWASRMRESLQAEYLTMLSGRYSCELALGNNATAIVDLLHHTSRFPTAERLVGQLMLALYRDGRAGEALDWFSRARLHLVAELGAEPGPELQELHRQVLRNDPSLALPPATPPRPVTPESNPQPAQLPADTNVFTGRAAQLMQLCSYAEGCASRQSDGPVITVIDGMPGVGKTALTVHAARRVADLFPDGQLFLDLHGFTPGATAIDPADALDRLLRSLGVPAARIPDNIEDRAALYRSTIHGRRLLVVLDNALDGDQVRPLLPADPGSMAIVTSRHRLLGLDDAYALPLDVLSKAEAADLFLKAARLGAAKPCSVQDRVTEIVELCGMLPLAIRIAAMRWRSRPHWSLESMLERLRQHEVRLPELEIGNRRLSTIFAASYLTLSGSHRQIFRLLSLIPGADFDVHGAAALIDSSAAEAEAGLTTLVDAHLLECHQDQRYRLHDLLRQYAAELSKAEDQAAVRDAARSRLYDMYRTASYHAGARLDPYMAAMEMPFEASPHAPVLSDRSRALQWWLHERVNLRNALDAAATPMLDEKVAFIARSMWAFLMSQYYLADGVRVASQGLAAARRLRSPVLEGILLNQRGTAYMFDTQYDSALVDCQGSHDIRAAIGDVRGQAGALNNLGNIYFRTGRFAESIRTYEEALELPESLVGEDLAGLLRSNCAMPYLRLGRAAEAINHLTIAGEIFRRLGNDIELSRVDYQMGEACRHAGDPVAALANHKKVLVTTTRLEDLRGRAYALNGIACDLRELGDPLAALRKHSDALAISREKFDRHLEIDVLCEQGRTLIAAGMFDRAIVHFREAATVAGTIRSPDYRAQALHGLGDALTFDGKATEARAVLEEAFALYQQCDVPQARELEARLRQVR